ERDESLGELLARHQQDGRLTDCLWGPLCVAALNTRVDEASAQVFLNVLRDVTSAGARASDLLLPRASLGALFAEPAVRHVVERGGEVHAGHAVRNIERRAHGYTIDGMHYDAVVIATAPQHAAALLPETCADSRALIAALDYQPIYTCYLQY